jgi:hypothetical protein
MSLLKRELNLIEDLNKKNNTEVLSENKIRIKELIELHEKIYSNYNDSFKLHVELFDEKMAIK